ncbi:MAG: nucleotidyltransferase substrate binding protein [Bacteroidales bacterium]|nr:nucleotidyltransferase substrate binding protein [Bacteroidales bacterium]
MTNNKDIRWEQRFSNFNKALKKLSEAIAFIKRNLDEKEIDIHTEDTEEILDEILKEGLIQRFEYTHELAWNVMKDFLIETGNIQIYGSKDATREAFKTGLIEDGDVWMEMIKSRNKTSHTYNEETADEIFTKIVNMYHSAFLTFEQVMESKRSGEQQNLFDKK